MREICLTNNNAIEIELVIEPTAESFFLKPKQMVLIKIFENENFSDPLDIEYSARTILIYEGRQMSLEIYLDKKLIYHTKEWGNG